jgi:peptide/nickel transport system permease protein
VLIGTVSGSIAACFRGWPDTVIIVATSIGVAIPNFVAAIILSMIFAVSLDWFPVIGDGEFFWDRLYHLTLPAISQAIVASALLSRVARSSIRNELQNEHVQTAIARGLPAGFTFRKHVLRNASGPMLSVVGLQVPAMLAGTVVIDRAFDLDGLGSLLLTGVNSSDFPIVQAVALIMVTATVVINVGVDIVLAFLDPRIRLDRRQ